MVTERNEGNGGIAGIEPRLGFSTYVRAHERHTDGYLDECSSFPLDREGVWGREGGKEPLPPLPLPPLPQHKEFSELYYGIRGPGRGKTPNSPPLNSYLEQLVSTTTFNNYLQLLPSTTTIFSEMRLVMKMMKTSRILPAHGGGGGFVPGFTLTLIPWGRMSLKGFNFWRGMR